MKFNKSSCFYGPNSAQNKFHHSFLSRTSFLFLVVSLSFANPAHAQNAKKKGTKTAAISAAQNNLGTLATIEVQGNRKIEKDAVLARLKSKVGESVTREKVREDLDSLFKSGFFYDVQVAQGGTPAALTLTYTVVEKPSISEIVIEGNEELKTEELLEGSGLKAFEILNMTKLRDGLEKIQKLYEDKGFYLAKIEHSLEDIKKDEQVKLVIKIDENEKVKVRKISFIGNQKLKDGFLKDRLGTNEAGFFTFMSGSGAYKQDVFDRDTQMLRFIYFNEGYIQVKIDRPQVYVTPDKKNMYITIRIDEGEQFDVGEIDFAGDILFSREELFQTVQVNSQKIFSYEKLQKDLSELQAKYGDLGYAFANVIPRTRINERDRKVDVTFEFDKGSKVYFGQINVVGNSKTRDKVVRRELKIREGELYNETRRRESLERVQRLGFFDEVNFKTSTPAEKPDILNIDIAVKERNTGSIQLGAGYGSASGFTLQGQINQSNFLGKGQKLGAGLNVSRDGSFYNLNFTEPYFRDTEWSLGFDLYQSSSFRIDYTEKKVGGALRAGHPLAEDLFGSLRYKYDRTNLEAEKDSNGQIETDLALFPLNTASGVTSSITGILEYDKRNDRFSPSKGIFASTSLEYAGVGGDLNYTKGNATFRFFHKVFWEVVWRNNLSYSFITSHESGVEPPFNELFLLGGPYSLRGYRFFRVGKTKFSQTVYDNNVGTVGPERATELANRPFGGKQQLLYQMEFEFPLIAEAGIKGVGFYDIGQAEDQISGDNFYSDVGFGFRWFSPIGPLRFEWGFPLRKNTASPDPVVFDFSIGAPF
ncbi:MAG: outer membrane protein assembly factor BamA [Pseudobdellovibrionaceae bacterium]